jgi:(p)ppGpp synthase/HD superfamily hydrolase
MEHRLTGKELDGSRALLGQKFDEALALAADLHRQQHRNDSPVPYISHLMAVAGIVLEANAYHPMDNLEDVAIGALLHDSVEDQGDKINLTQIRQRFGETVEQIVFECSDAIMVNADDTKPLWRERKEKYLAGIHRKSRETLLVSCADKTHNARCILFDFDRIGARIWSRFRGGKDGTVWYYNSLAAEFERAWPDNPLLPEFDALVTRMKMIGVDS